MFGPIRESQYKAATMFDVHDDLLKDVNFIGDVSDGWQQLLHRQFASL